MCIIVHNPIGVHLDKATAERMWKTNDDGGGFAFIDDNGELQVEKFMEWKDFWPSFESARSTFPGRNYLLHMRIGTHGTKDLDNVHPFQVDEHTVMAHNGIFHKVTARMDKDDPRSDTRFFVDEVLPSLPENWLDDPWLPQMVTDWMGWSKLMFLTTNPALEANVYRLGDWKEFEGLHVSNDNGLRPVYTTTYTTKSNKIENLGRPGEGEYGGWKPTVYVGGKAATETTDDWDEFFQYQQKRSEKELDEYEFTSDDFQYLLEQVKKERASMCLMSPILILSEKDGEMECTKCEIPIDLDTAECGCWERVCNACWVFLAICECPETVTNAKDYKTHHFSILKEKGKEWVEKRSSEVTQGNEDLSTMVDLVIEDHLSNGAGNTALESTEPTGSLSLGSWE